jgi:hypothetical protein
LSPTATVLQPPKHQVNIANRANAESGDGG